MADAMASTGSGTDDADAAPQQWQRPVILMLDAHDSFTNNIVALLTTQLGADVHVLDADDPVISALDQSSLSVEFGQYDAVVCGPGPGSPTVPADVGLIGRIWDLVHPVPPVLGVCLGFQSLVSHFGGRVRSVRGGGLHGTVHAIDHRGLDLSSSPAAADIFTGTPSFSATLYHSLHVDVGLSDASDLNWPYVRWTSSSTCPEIVPLAWTRDGDRILMAARHKHLPFWGLQYHPESVCTDSAAHGVLTAWFAIARRWNTATGRHLHGRGRPGLHLPGRVRPAAPKSLLSHFLPGSSQLWAGCDSGLAGHTLGRHYVRRTVPLPAHLEAPDLMELLGQANAAEAVILDSSDAAGTEQEHRGRFSIMALGLDDALRLESRVGQPHIIARQARTGLAQSISLTPYQGNIWLLLSHFLHRRRLSDPPGLEDVPFIGGFVGFVTYEMGLGSIGISRLHRRGPARPDLSLVWVTRSMVIDHRAGLLHLQWLAPASHTTGACSWLDEAVDVLTSSKAWQRPSRLPEMAESTDDVEVCAPDPTAYQMRVLRCQQHIAAGDSYELCLTDQTTVRTGRPRSPWQLYRRLRRAQPAPFSSFLRLSGATLISSSPERFLTVDGAGMCTMRPMKGTVRRGHGSGSASTLAEAQALLSASTKERAENLMIVDLVRHDMHGVCGPAAAVSVPGLMRVEEYASVYQMVSLVRAPLPAGGTGLDLLAACLPPGSMTGAPKRRSCELLVDIEAPSERGLYSGLVGYIDVGGRCDWSVTIRSLFRWEDEDDAADDRGHGGQGRSGQVWHIGAGGAVTALSRPEDEWAEMLAKLAGPLSAFYPAKGPADSRDRLVLRGMGQR